MSSNVQGSSMAVSVVTSDAAVDHSSQQSTHSASRGKTSRSKEIKSLPLKKRPLASVEPRKSKTPSKKKQRLSKSKEEGPDLLDPARRVAILRSLPDDRAPTPEQVSTDLVLCTWPWKIQKKLHKSDLNNLSRLLLPKGDVKTHVLPHLSDEMVAEVGDTKGMGVTVWDRDTSSDHPLVLKYWWSSGSFLLNGNWIGKFKNRRGLKVGDEIGLFWNHYNQKFFFTVLKRGG